MLMLNFNIEKHSLFQFIHKTHISEHDAWSLVSTVECL